MQRDWIDPRDGGAWLVTLTPIGGSAQIPDRLLPGRYTVAFHRPGELPVWTPVDRPVPLERMGDQLLMDLLDEARGESIGPRRGAEVRRRRTPGRAVPGP